MTLNLCMWVLFIEELVANVESFFAKRVAFIWMRSSGFDGWRSSRCHAVCPSRWIDRHGGESSGRIRSSEMINTILALPGGLPIRQSSVVASIVRRTVLAGDSLFAAHAPITVDCPNALHVRTKWSVAELINRREGMEGKEKERMWFLDCSRCEWLCRDKRRLSKNRPTASLLVLGAYWLAAHSDRSAPVVHCM